jgi:uncharacterized protein YecT (DUF1311 family)
MQNIVLFLLLFTPAILIAQPMSALPSPCTERPESQRQMNDCAAFKYEVADAHLNSVYGKEMQYMADDLVRARKALDQTRIKDEQSEIASLKDAERAWLSYRDVQCKAASQRYEGGSMRPMIYSQCLTTLTEHRIADLKSVYEDGDRKLD